ncbi:MAG: tetratricopeptide repeat protein [Thermonemataceae bacterium]|nr:tetratricopeptide repeat protein [Thermonemataceae bacterium]
MKKISLIIFCIFTGFLSFAQKWDELNKQGSELRKAGKYPEAIKTFLEAKQAVEKKYGKTHKNYAIVLNNLALAYDESRDYPQAEASYKEAIEAYRVSLGEKSEFCVVTMENLGLLYQQQGKYKDAEALYSKSLAINKEILGTKNPAYAASLENLAQLAEKSGNRKKAEELYLELLGLQRDNLGEKNPAYANALENMAKFYQNEGQFTLAEDFFQQTLKIRKKNVGDKHPDYANTLNNLALMYKVAGKAEKAQLTYEEALTIYKTTLGNRSNAYAVTVKNLADLYFSQAKYAKAEQYYAESRDIIKTNMGDKHPDYALALCDLAKIHYNKNEYGKAEPLYVEALGILQTQGKNNPQYALIVNNLASLYRMQGNFDKAEPLFEESLKINKEVLGDKHPKYALALYNLAVLYNQKGKYDKVEAMYKEVVEICRANPSDANLFGNSLNSLANLYNNKGEFDKAEPLYKEAIKVLRTNLGKKHPAYAKALSNLAILYRQKGKYDKALEMLQEVADIRKEVLGEQHVEYAKALLNIAQIYYLNKDYVKAEPLYIQVNHIYINQIFRNFATLSEKEKEIYFKTFSNTFNKFNSFMLLRKDANPAIITEAYNNQLVIKGLMLSEQNRLRKTILASKNEELIKTYQDWQALKNELAQITMQGGDNEVSADSIKKLETEIESLEKTLSLKSASFSDALQKKPITFEDIKNALAEGEIALELVRFNKYEYKYTDSVYYAIFLVSKNTAVPELILLPSSNNLEKEYLAYYRNMIRSRKTDVKSYQNLWKTIDDKIKVHNAKKIYFASDGIYYLINPATLQEPQSKKYVADEIDLHLLTSTRDIIEIKSDDKTKPLSSAFLVGSPNFEQDDTDNTITNTYKDTSSVSFEEMNYQGVISSLPGTKKEVENIENILKVKNFEIEKLTDTQASESTIKNINNPSILHIATHGYFMSDVENNDEEEGQKEKKQGNVLMRSGLLLAGSQKTLNKERKGNEDGILTAYEAQTLDLNETSLVILSACETATGELKNGEGVFGLQRAFQVAGAKSVVTSLWKVDDTATQILMTSFYNNLLKGESKRQAMQTAQKEIRAKYPQPYYWGAFVMVGD